MKWPWVCLSAVAAFVMKAGAASSEDLDIHPSVLRDLLLESSEAFLPHVAAVRPSPFALSPSAMPLPSTRSVLTMRKHTPGERKTVKAAAKRIKVTAGGKLMRKIVGRQHLLSKKSGQKKMKKRRVVLVDGTNAMAIKRMLNAYQNNLK